MTGAEHFKEAERLLADAKVPGEKRSVKNFLPVETLTAVAQAHATLAAACAYGRAAAELAGILHVMTERLTGLQEAMLQEAMQEAGS